MEAAAPAVSTGVLHKEWKIQSPKNTPCINNTLASTPPHVRKHKVDTWAVTSSPVCCGACWQQDGGPSVREEGGGVVGQNWETHAYDITAHLPDVVTPGVSPGMTRPWSGSGCCRANWPAVFIPQHSCTRTDTLQPILPGIRKRLDWLQFTFCTLTVGVQSTGIILVIFQRPPHSCILLSAMQILFFPAWSCLYLCLSYRCIVHLPAARCVSTAELLHLFNIHCPFYFHSKITFFSHLFFLSGGSFSQIQIQIVLSVHLGLLLLCSHAYFCTYLGGSNRPDMDETQQRSQKMCRSSNQTRKTRVKNGKRDNFFRKILSKSLGYQHRNK